MSKEDLKPEVIDDHMQIDDDEGYTFGSFGFKALVCKGLYPHVFIFNTDYYAIPSVGHGGFITPGAPHALQCKWIDLDFDFERWKAEVLKPYFANLIYYKMNGEFANGYDEGPDGIIRQLSNLS